MTQTTDNTELRIVRGNGFSVKITIEARRLDGTVIEDFSLADADATLNVIYYDTKTAYDFAVSDNDAVISFPSDLALGWYGLEMIGTYNGIAWRWCVQKVLQIVETNEKANIPNWTILADDTYIVSGVLTLTGADSSTQVQADWEQTDTTAKSYIKHKPDLTKYSRLDESNEHESGTYDEWAGTNTQVKVTGSYITLTKYGDDGSVIQISPDRIRFVGTNTPNPFTGENWEYVLAAAQTQPDWEETNPGSHGYILNKPDLSEYVTSSTLATALANYVTTSALTTALANYVTTSALATALADYATQNWVEAKGFLTNSNVDDVPTANSKNPVTSGGVYDALQGEYVVVTAIADTGSVATAMVGIYDVNDVLIVEGEGEVTARILYGKTYKVKCSRVYDYLTPAEQTFTASVPSRQVTMQYTYIERDVVTLDQTISDSAQMLSGDIQGAVIKEIRSHSHLYLGTPATQSGDTEGTELLCQLSDEDSRLYYDGTPAALDGSEGDQWLKLPVFWWKIVGVGEAAADGAHDQYRFMFAFDGEPDPSWNKWQGDRNLVGAKEMNVVDGKGRSVSGGQSTGNFTQAQGNAYAEARNLGCQEVTWEWQWMMCMLCYAWNGDTNSQETNGIGSNSCTRTLGVTDQLGMTDTTPAQAISLTSARFWGLEAWWNCKSEWMGNVVMENDVLSITDQDTKQTRQVSGFIQCSGTGGWNSRMRIDANGDFVPLAKAGTETTYYCDYVNSNSGSRVLFRSHDYAYAYGGVAYVSALHAPSVTSARFGSRLAFNGIITEAESVAAYKAALV